MNEPAVRTVAGTVMLAVPLYGCASRASRSPLAMAP